MADLNKVQLIGRLGADPERRGAGETGGVAKLRVATSYRKAGEEVSQELTDWHDVVAFGALGDNCCKYLSKGRLIYVEGRLASSSWKTPAGEARMRREVIAHRVDFLGAQTSAARKVA